MTSDPRRLASAFSGTLADTGRRPSVFSARTVGLMRRVALSGALVTGAGIAALGYAHLETRRPVLRKYRAEVPARPGFSGLRVLHVSDLHMYPGREFFKDFFKHIVARERIDMVVSTGDNLADPDSLPELLAAYEPLLQFPGAFVLGSNDYYSPLSKNWLSYLHRKDPETAKGRSRRDQPDLPWLEMVSHFRKSDWVDLSNRSDQLDVSGVTVALTGVDDPHIRRDRMPTPPAAWFDDSSVRLGLTHSPYRRVLDGMALNQTDLICAGHTHGGQVRIPGFGALVTNSDLPRKYASGLHQWSPPEVPNSKSWLHVSAGLGNSPYAAVRFDCRPEVSLIELVPSS